jgi:hypothetical protein
MHKSADRARNQIRNPKTPFKFGLWRHAHFGPKKSESNQITGTKQEDVKENSQSPHWGWLLARG